MANDVRIDGLDQLRAAVRKLPDVVRRHAGTVNTATGDRVVSTARANVPKRRGVLQGEIVAVAGEDGAVNVGVTTRGFYGAFLEFGTVRHGAHPFMGPAAAAEQQPHVARMVAAGKTIEEEMSQ
ncbi:MAG: HK97 gp10 family phage protein [Acidobacteria bacterium]|nr:HK97 gp10 family phage protein [Acidobacteriota bacterium]MCA1650786.1 HK97 gp10 family phage protein [Acidobacteriota bacterium]